MSQAPTGGGGMDPLTSLAIGGAINGIGAFANNLTKPKEPKVDTSADWYSQFIGSMFGGANAGESFATTQAQIAAGEAAGLRAMYGGAERDTQLAAFGQGLDEQRTASNLQAGIAGQSAGAALGLEESAGKGKLATELQPVQTAGELAKSYADAAGKISQQGTLSLGDIAGKEVSGTQALGQQGIQAQQGIAEKTIGAASEQGTAAQQGTSLLANTLQQGTTELGKQTLTGETALLQPTATGLAQAGTAALAGENALAQNIAKTNLDIKKQEQSTLNQLALQRDLVAGKLAMQRFGLQAALGGHAMFS
jgi:hypothetical protein